MYTIYIYLYICIQGDRDLNDPNSISNDDLSTIISNICDYMSLHSYKTLGKWIYILKYITYSCMLYCIYGRITR